MIRNSSFGFTAKLYPKCLLFKNTSRVRRAISMSTQSRRSCSVLFLNIQKTRFLHSYKVYYDRTRAAYVFYLSGFKYAITYPMLPFATTDALDHVPVLPRKATCANMKQPAVCLSVFLYDSATSKDLASSKTFSLSLGREGKTLVYYET